MIIRSCISIQNDEFGVSFTFECSPRNIIIINFIIEVASASIAPRDVCSAIGDESRWNHNVVTIVIILYSQRS